MDLRIKQELLESGFKQLWGSELREYFKNAKSLGSNKGIHILIEVLSDISKDFDSLFKNKRTPPGGSTRLIARKDYLKPLATLDYSNIISICLSKVLPFLESPGPRRVQTVFSKKNNDDSDVHVTSLFHSIGVTLYK